MKNYTLQALDEDNITFLKADKRHAQKTWNFTLGIVFLLLLGTLSCFALIIP